MIGKLVVDYDEVSLGDLLEFLTDKGVECCVDGDNIYVYSNCCNQLGYNTIILDTLRIRLDIQGTISIVSEKEKINRLQYFSYYMKREKISNPRGFGKIL